MPPVSYAPAMILPRYLMADPDNAPSPPPPPPPPGVKATPPPVTEAAPAPVTTPPVAAGTPANPTPGFDPATLDAGAQQPDTKVNVRTASKSARIVTILCKLPHGLILSLLTRHPQDKNIVVSEDQVVLFGANAASKGGEVSNGFGVTQVDENFWNEWISQPNNRALPAIRQGLIMVSREPNNPNAQTKEMMGQRTGLEPLNPNKPGPGLQPIDRDNDDK